MMEDYNPKLHCLLEFTLDALYLYGDIIVGFTHILYNIAKQTIPRIAT